MIKIFLINKKLKKCHENFISSYKSSKIHNHRKYYGKFFLIFSIKPPISFSYFLQSSKTLYCKFSCKDSIIISIIFFKLRREYKKSKEKPFIQAFQKISVSRQEQDF